MALTHLPTELLEAIVEYTVPEGLESTALTCKQFHAICRPFIKPTTRDLRDWLHDFAYYADDFQWTNDIRTAFDLINRIAQEPLLARYIRHADFSSDSRHTKWWGDMPRCLPAEFYCEAAVRELLADSPHLQRAALDWQQYHANIRKDLETTHYSQHAAAFLMTLLPNLESMTLAKLWIPLAATDQLIRSLTNHANEPRLPNITPSLAQLTRIEVLTSTGSHFSRVVLGGVVPFLALPRLQSLHGISCTNHIRTADNPTHSDPSNDTNIGQALTSIDLVACCIDDIVIGHLLKHTPRLRKLQFSYATRRHPDPQEWDICKFLAAIECQVGSHLEELSISIRHLQESIPPGKTSMLGFQRLRKLELPIEVVLSNISGARGKTPAKSAGDGFSTHEDDPYISDLVPVSVHQLSLISNDGSNEHAKAIELIFRDFAARKGFTLPALQEIQLSCPNDADDAYKNQCNKLLAECEKTDVVWNHPLRCLHSSIKLPV
ncbi:MAG: hypothetical protein Q9226_004275 [Calogaya cf. arnoldii]